MSNLYIGPSIDVSYQISDQLALRFQRRRLKCEKLTDDGRQVWQGELKTTIEFACPGHVTVNNLKLLQRKIWGKFSTTDCSGKCDLVAKISLWTLTGIFF